MVHELNEVLHVWADHFGKIGTPKELKNYDKNHFVSVSNFVANRNCNSDFDEFLDRPFTYDEVYKAVKTLHILVKHQDLIMS